MVRECDCCGARDCTVSPGGDVDGVARPAACWKCRGEKRPECYECGTEVLDGETCAECDGRACTYCEEPLAADYLANACLTCIALEDGDPLPEAQGRDGWAP